MLVNDYIFCTVFSIELTSEFYLRVYEVHVRNVR